MGKTVLFEGILLIIISAVAIVEGFRLVIYKPPHVVQDPLGPGLYVILLSLGTMASGVAHLVAKYKTSVRIENNSTSTEMKIKVMSVVGVFVLYLFLIPIVGYVVATMIFFFLEFRVSGVKSWLTNIASTLIFSMAYYIIFVKCCEMIFPIGILFQ